MLKIVNSHDFLIFEHEFMILFVFLQPKSIIPLKMAIF